MRRHLRRLIVIAGGLSAALIGATPAVAQLNTQHLLRGLFNRLARFRSRT